MRNILKKACVCVALFICLIIPQGTISAQDFAGNESYYMDFCSIPRSNRDEMETCKAFKDYYRQKSENLQNQIGDLNTQLDSIKGNMDLLTQAINEYDGKIAELTTMIEENDTAIAKMQEGIDALDGQIIQTQKDIDVRDDQIKDRMRSEQPSVGTNVYMDFIMGAADLMDLIRTIEGLERITENDQEQIMALQNDKEKLDVQKGEQIRLQDEVKEKKEQNEESKASTEAAKLQKQEFLNEYQRQEAELNEQKRSAQVDIETIQNNIINIQIDPSGIGGNSYWTMPVTGGYKSAGTWYYPGGGLHLGMDIAAPIGTPIVAPANSVILYAANPAPTNGGYLGNWVGYPAGGGNTVQLVMEVNGITYAVSFFHMARENFSARAGATLDRGQQFGTTGNAGNSTGPHCHIEVINLGTIGLSAAISQFQRNYDFAWGNGWGNGALNRICSATGGAAPCRERPEDIFS